MPRSLVPQLTALCCIALLGACAEPKDDREFLYAWTAGVSRRVELLKFDAQTGALSRDRTIVDVGGVPHGTVFSRP